MRVTIVLFVLCILIGTAGCGTEYAAVGELGGESIGVDANSNLLRVARGRIVDVRGTVGRSEGLTPRWSEQVDEMSSRHPQIVRIERLDETTFRLTAVSEGETVLRVVGDDEERFVPIRVMPADWSPPTPPETVP